MSSPRLTKYVPEAQLFAARLVLFQDAVARQLGLGSTDLKCFRLIQLLGPLTASELVGETGLTPASVSVIVERLVTRNYLSKEQDQANRRRWSLRAQPQAVEAVDKLYTAHQHAAEQLLASLTEPEFAFAVRFMQEFAEALKVSTKSLLAGT